MQRYFCCVLGHVISPTLASGDLEKANMLLVTKEATNKDRSLKTQMLLSTSESKFWKKHGYFSNERANFNIEKRNFPENTLCYFN